jgi:hypothetical protein
MWITIFAVQSRRTIPGTIIPTIIKKLPLIASTLLDQFSEQYPRFFDTLATRGRFFVRAFPRGLLNS